MTYYLMKKKWSQKGGEDNQVQLKHQTKEGTFRKNTTKSTFRVLIKVSLPWTNGYWHHARQVEPMVTGTMPDKELAGGD